MSTPCFVRTAKLRRIRGEKGAATAPIVKQSERR
jgi:hypothetical protein